jgi:hypothetical protein
MKLQINSLTLAYLGFLKTLTMFIFIYKLKLFKS